MYITLTEVYLSGRLRLPETDGRICGSSGHSTTGSDQSECAVHLQNCTSATCAWWWRDNRLPQCRPRSLVAKTVLERRPPAAKKSPADWPRLPPCLWHLCQIPWQAAPCWRCPLPGQYNLLTWCSQTCECCKVFPENTSQLFNMNYYMPDRNEQIQVWHSAVWRRLCFLLPSQTGHGRSWAHRQFVITAQEIVGFRQPLGEDSHSLQQRIVGIFNHYI